MGEAHQLGEVVISKENSKGQNVENLLAQKVQSLWEETHRNKNADKRTQDHEFSSKLAILDRRLHQDGGLLSGKNAKDLHLVGLGHNAGKAKLFFSDKNEGKAEGKNLYLVDESGKIVASSELKDRKAVNWKRQSESHSNEEVESKRAESASSSASTTAEPLRKDQYDLHQGSAKKNDETQFDDEISNSRRIKDVRDPFKRIVRN